jgi:hypothetical protein
MEIYLCKAEHKTGEEVSPFHGMQGFDYEKARKDLEVPDNFDIVAMIAIS